MHVADCRRLRAGLERDRPIERDVDAEEGRSPLVTLELGRRIRADDLFAEQIEPQVPRIGVDRDHPVDRDSFAVRQAKSGGSSLLDDDAGDLRTGSDRPTNARGAPSRAPG